jgi:hypothetical protein
VQAKENRPLVESGWFHTRQNLPSDGGFAALIGADAHNLIEREDDRLDVQVLELLGRDRRRALAP